MTIFIFIFWTASTFFVRVLLSLLVLLSAAEPLPIPVSLIQRHNYSLLLWRSFTRFWYGPSVLTDQFYMSCKLGFCVEKLLPIATLFTLLIPAFLFWVWCLRCHTPNPDTLKVSIKLPSLSAATALTSSWPTSFLLFLFITTATYSEYSRRDISLVQKAEDKSDLQFFYIGKFIKLLYPS